MADSSIRLARDLTIPTELTSEDSNIGSLIEVARTVSSSNSYAAKVLAERAQALIKNACSHYKPNEASRAGIMCASGRDAEIPFRGKDCCLSGCIVSQVQKNEDGFKFVGKRPVEDALVRAIFREVPTDEDDARKRPEAQEAD